MDSADVPAPYRVGQWLPSDHAFLARWLGGRAEPIGEDFAGSSHEIRAGGEFIQGLPA